MNKSSAWKKKSASHLYERVQDNLGLFLLTSPGGTGQVLSCLQITYLVLQSAENTNAVALGGLLLIMAIKTYMGEYDPDGPLPKLLTTLDKMGPGKLFLGGIVLSIIQIRFVALVLAGVVITAEAQLPAGQNLIAILLLAFFIVWTLLIPVAVFLAMGDSRDAALDSMNAWLVVCQSSNFSLSFWNGAQ